MLWYYLILVCFLFLIIQVRQPSKFKHFIKKSFEMEMSSANCGSFCIDLNVSLYYWREIYHCFSPMSRANIWHKFCSELTTIYLNQWQYIITNAPTPVGAGQSVKLRFFLHFSPSNSHDVHFAGPSWGKPSGDRAHKGHWRGALIFSMMWA